MQWRAMRENDIQKVADLADVVHLDYPENPAVFMACFRCYPDGCHVLADPDGSLGGYLVSHPGRFDQPPVLNRPLEILPEPADCYFLHDLALVAKARGRGHAGEAVNIVIDEACRAGMDTVALIAVGDAHGFWAAHGFTPLGDGMVPANKGYGAEARALIRKI